MKNLQFAVRVAAKSPGFVLVTFALIAVVALALSTHRPADAPATTDPHHAAAISDESRNAETSSVIPGFISPVLVPLLRPISCAF